MLTRAQLQRLAQRSGIGLQAQEREYTKFSFPSCLRVFVVKKPPGHQDTKFSLSSCLCAFVVRKE
jgi:hypothetical protein